MMKTLRTLFALLTAAALVLVASPASAHNGVTEGLFNNDGTYTISYRYTNTAGYSIADSLSPGQYDHSASTANISHYYVPNCFRYFGKYTDSNGNTTYFDDYGPMNRYVNRSASASWAHVSVYDIYRVC